MDRLKPYPTEEEVLEREFPPEAEYELKNPSDARQAERDPKGK